MDDCMDIWMHGCFSACIRHDLRPRVGPRGSPKNYMLMAGKKKRRSKHMFSLVYSHFAEFRPRPFMSHMAADSSHVELKRKTIKIMAR